MALLQDLVKQLSVLSRVHIFRGSSEDLHTHLDQRFRELDRRLSAELHDCSVRFLNIYHILHILGSQRLKIQLVRNIKVRTYGLRVIVDDNRLISLFRKCPGTVYGTEVELDTLSDADRAGAQDKHFFLITSAVRLILSAVYGIVIRSRGSELSGAGIYHLIRCGDVPLAAQFFDLIFFSSGQARDDIIRELDALRLAQQIFRQLLLTQRLLHLHEDRQLVDKPDIDLRDLMDLLVGNALADRFGNTPDPHIVYNL